MGVAVIALVAGGGLLGGCVVAHLRIRGALFGALDDCAGFRWAPVPFGPDHQAIAEHVERFVGLGYLVHSHTARTLDGRSWGGTVLTHVDGSIVDVWATKAGPTASVASPLADGAVVETLSRAPTFSTPERLLQMTESAAPDALVDAHRAAVAWLADQGVGVVADPRGPGAVLETSAHAIGRLRAEGLSACVRNLRSSVARHGRPLWEQEGAAGIYS